MGGWISGRWLIVALVGSLVVVGCTAQEQKLRVEIERRNAATEGTEPLVVSLLSAPPGTLPPVHGAIVAGIDLGEGLLPEPQFGLSSTPILWMSINRLDGDVWAELVGAFPETGLWPLVLDNLEPERPWRSGEFGLDVFDAEPDDVEPLDLLNEWSSRAVDRLATGSEATELTIHIPATGDLWTTLGLVPVQRPADVTWALGWTGDTNYGRDQAHAASLYRSWEDRFGAYIVRLGFAEISLSVARPPAELGDARLVALEHYAWCPTLDELGVDIEEYAKSLLDKTSWGCWWD